MLKRIKQMFKKVWDKYVEWLFKDTKNNAKYL